MAINYADNPWSAWLEEEPQALYNALLPRDSTTPFADYYRSLYSDTYGNYMGKLGQMGLAGQDPTLSFYEYLQSQNPLKAWQLLSPSQRGEKTARSLAWNVRL
jgi:hypothetical protein